DERAAGENEAALAAEFRRAEAPARLPVFLAGRREDVEHDATRVEGAPAVGHVRRRLPEVSGVHVMFHTVLDTNPLALEADAPLLGGRGVHGGDGEKARSVRHPEPSEWKRRADAIRLAPLFRPAPPQG